MPFAIEPNPYSFHTFNRMQIVESKSSYGRIMNLSEMLKESLISVLDQLRLALWIEIVTEQPGCTYYFGPFARAKSAQKAVSGYIEDLKEESAQVIAVTFKRVQPRELTIESDQLRENFESQLSPAISGFEDWRR